MCLIWCSWLINSESRIKQITQISQIKSGKAMKFQQKITFSFLLTIVWGSAVFAQVVEIPDPNLRAAIADALDIPRGAPITQDDMNLLTYLDANRRGIMELSGLDTATQLVSLSLGQNAIADLSPLAHLTNMRSLDLRFNQINDISPLSRLIKLEILIVPDNRINDLGPLAHLPRLVELNARVNPISDVAPLFHLTTLKYLDLGGCRIVNISPLSNLTNLQVLQLNNNQIVDVSPLSNLTSLYKLEIQYNHIVDHSPLDSLSLDIFYYDQTCDMPSLPLEPRLENRNYPSIFSRWTGFGAYPVSNRPDLSEAENLALHDLWFGGDVFGLFLFETGNTFATRGNIEHATRQRDELLANNPNIIQLRTLSARAASLNSFPKDWPHWLRDEQGNIFLGRDSDGTIWTNGIMDITQPEVQDRIVEQAIAVDKCGLYDGIIFDYWSDSWRVLGSWDGTRDYFPYSLEEERRARLNIVRRIQAATRPNFLIMGNTNRAILPITGPYVNGGFMETVFPAFHAEDALHDSLTEIEDSLYWLDTNLRQPRINGLEGWSIPTEPPDSPMNLRWMRAITTLSLTHSNGYVVFTEPVKWTHYWYDFWDADLGRPVGEKGQLYQGIDGLYVREFTNGWALYNHSGAPHVITLPEEAQGVASGLVNTEHALANLDGEMYLRVKPKNPADVNDDGVVNILDLTLVAQALGTDKPEADVNGDGFVNILDLVFVANEF